MILVSSEQPRYNSLRPSVSLASCVSPSSSPQLCDLRVRLERAEAERQELQDELRRERGAREKLELLISQLQQQITSSANHSPQSIYSANHSPQNTDSDNHSPNTPTPANHSPRARHTHSPAATHKGTDSS